MGQASMSDLMILGGSISSGSLLLMEVRARSTSATTWLTSAPSRNLSRMVDRPSTEEDAISRIPERPLSACSMG